MHVKMGRGVRSRAGLFVLLCAVTAVVAFIFLAGTQHTLAGVALALGILIGSANASFISRSVASGLPFATLSLARLALFSVLGLGLGLLLGIQVAWLVLVGMGVSQLLLAGMNAVEIARR